MEEDQTAEEARSAIEQRIDTLKQELAVAAALETIRTKVINRYN
jgi:hypothetical protein